MWVGAQYIPIDIFILDDRNMVKFRNLEFANFTLQSRPNGNYEER